MTTSENPPTITGSLLQKCPINLYRLVGQWTRYEGDIILKVIRVKQRSGGCKLWLLAHSNLNVLVLNCHVIQEVPLQAHQDRLTYVSKVWSVTPSSSNRCVYAIKFIGENALLNANAFKMFWSHYSGTPFVEEPDEDIPIECHDDDRSEAEAVENAVAAVLTSGTIRNETGVDDLAGEESARNFTEEEEEDDSAKDDDDEDDVSRNLLESSSDDENDKENEEEEEEEDGEYVIRNAGRLGKIRIYKEWNGEALDESQAY